MQATMSISRLPGAGWLVLIGGGEFSFGETLEADTAWLAKTPPGPVGFLPTASGSDEYGRHFAAYLGESFGREVRVIPIYRPRDARRAKNLQRIEEVVAIYFGGGVTDHLLDTLADSPAATAVARKLGQGGVVVGIAAAAQALGLQARSVFGGKHRPGLGWLPGGVIEPNFHPAHDRRLRQLLQGPSVEWGLGLPTGSAILMCPEKTIEWLGTWFLLDDDEGDFQIVQ